MHFVVKKDDDDLDIILLAEEIEHIKALGLQIKKKRLFSN